MDIMQNSIAAGSRLTELFVNEQPTEDFLEFTVKDNGCGMDKEQLKKVVDPYTTGRTTRRVGLGIPLLKSACENTGGALGISSEKNKGTTLTATFGYSHIDREPLGDMAQTILQIITSYEDVDFVYTHKVEKKEYSLDTRELKKILGDVSFNLPEITLWLSEYLKENENELYKKTGKE